MISSWYEKQPRHWSCAPMDAMTWSIGYLAHQAVGPQPWFYRLDFIIPALQECLSLSEDVPPHTSQTVAKAEKEQHTGIFVLPG